jgi:hypothetical protein
MSRAWYKLPENEQRRTRQMRWLKRGQRRGENKTTRGLGPCRLIGQPFKGLR